MANQLKKLTASNIKYLLVIRELSSTADHVRSADIAKILDVTRPSVHRMIKALQTMGLVEKDRYGTISFTQYGAAITNQYSQYFETICGYFNELLPCDFDIKSVSCAVLAELRLGDAECLCRNMGTASSVIGRVNQNKGMI